MKVRLLPFSATALVATSLSATAFLFAQNEKPSSSAPTPPAAPTTTPDQSAEKSDKPVPPQAAAPQAAATQPKTTAATPAKPDVPRAMIHLAGHDARDHTAKKYMGHHLRGNDGRDLGAVKDFLLDPHTGKVDFAVISSGGIVGMGDKLRLVPTAALKRTQKKDEFTVDVSEEQWKRLVALADDEFKSGEVTIPDAQRRQIAQAFEHRAAPAVDSVYTASLTTHLVRASDLSGRDVHSGSGKLGEMEAIVLDLEAGTAQALVDPNHDFTGTKAKLLVPFNQFTISGGKRPQVTTLLTRSDFQQLRPDSTRATGLASSSTGTTPPPQPVAQPNADPSKSAPALASTQPNASTQKSASTSPAQAAPAPSTSASTRPAVAANEPPAKTPPASTDPTVSSATDRSGRVAATEKSPATRDENLSPTGQDSADSIPAGIDPALLATARAIRKALDNDPALARADVRVTPEEQKIVLRGRVNDQKTKTAIIEKATSEVKGWKIDDQITIDNR